MPKSSLSIAGLLGLICSLFFGSFLMLSWLWSFLIICVALSLIVYLLGKRNIAIISIIFLLGFVIGLVRVEHVFQEKSENHIVHFLKQESVWTGVIVEEVDIREQRVQYIVELQNKEDTQVRGRSLIKAQKSPMYEYGDILEITGTLTAPENHEDFNYQNYLERYEIYGIFQFAKIKKTGTDVPSYFKKWIYTQKQWFLGKIQAKYQEPYASFLSGLLIGDRKGMSPEIQNDFQKTGLSHIVAVSGSNITMMLAVLLTLLVFLPRMIAFASSIFAIIVFTIFVGMSAAVVRAAIMGIIALIAIHSGRPKAPFIALLTTVAIMGFYQPKIFLYDIGFQLSIAAVIGVIWIVPLFPKFFQQLPEQFGIKEAVALTLAAQITTLPLSLYHFQMFSLIAPIANLFVVPLIPFAMLFGFLSLIPLPFLSELLVFLTTLILKMSLFFTEFFAALPFAAWEM